MPGKMFWAFLILIAGIILVTVWDMQQPTVQTTTVAELIDRLDDPQTVVRHAAAQQLTNRGKDVLPELLDSIIQNETARRLKLSVLEDLLLSPDEDVHEAVESGMAQLRQTGKQDLNREVERIFSVNSALRHSRAYRKIEALGGAPRVISYRRLANRLQTLPIDFVVVDGTWHGTDEDWVHFFRLSTVVTLYITRDAAISSDALQRLKAEGGQSGRVLVRTEQESCIGIMGHARPNGYHVQGVLSASPAFTAGIEALDTLLSINGQPLAGQDLRQVVSEFPAGTRLIIEVKRGETRLEIPVLTGSDFGTGMCACWE